MTPELRILDTVIESLDKVRKFLAKMRAGKQYSEELYYCSECGEFALNIKKTGRKTCRRCIERKLKYK